MGKPAFLSFPFERVRQFLILLRKLAYSEELLSTFPWSSRKNQIAMLGTFVKGEPLRQTEFPGDVIGKLQSQKSRRKAAFKNATSF